ncbi:DUF4333 domain-containing protein [Calidifontibacter sp. DB0510]|uniref:DUF4333 domain-containing protein n=1 Tax=Metallococcus carri TaxID=1656884 RepID=A0A967B2X6_9MICO|nr:DUF4333 domain-containing protein [Metallococcus carri]NHN57037.1 DUF4333 domain-containing protein [Metallococcus carri]NOP39094.1 DUF4333 domain-containing protein [Calidifontibacter sp. DB2511S]
MTVTLRRGAAAIASSALLIGGLAACGQNAVSKSSVQSTIKSKLAEKGVSASDVKCEKDLKAEKGATTDCTAKVSGSTQKFKVVVDSVNGKTVNYTIKKG